MKKSTPISLFSFQDIITCLTGVMIVIVLVIILQLVETTAAFATKSKLQPEYLALKQQQSALLQQRDALALRVQKMAKETSAISDMSLAELNYLLQQEKKYAEIIVQEQSSLQKRLGDLTLEVEKAELESEKIKLEIRELAKEENYVLELHAQLLALQNRQSKINEMIETKRKMLRFEFAGDQSKTPILVECNYWGFRARRYPSGPLKAFGEVKSNTSVQEQIPDLIAWLKQEDLEQCYPVLLVREAVLPVYNDLLRKLWAVDDTMAMGQEPLGAEEECFE
jgi:hypothetical protein